MATERTALIIPTEIDGERRAIGDNRRLLIRSCGQGVFVELDTGITRMTVAVADLLEAIKACS